MCTGNECHTCFVGDHDVSLRYSNSGDADRLPGGLLLDSAACGSWDSTARENGESECTRLTDVAAATVGDGGAYAPQAGTKAEQPAPT